MSGVDFSIAPDATAMCLFVPPFIYAKGVDWVRAAYRVGPDVLILESKPLPRAQTPDGSGTP